MQAPPDYEQLLELVAAALEDGDPAIARRHLVRARARLGAGEEELRGAIAALELVCGPRADLEAHEDELRGLSDGSGDDGLPFANAVGCTLSDIGERLGDTYSLLLAETWFAALSAADPGPIISANHGIVLERLERHEEAVAALARALELDPELDGARLRIARIASRMGDFERAATEYRAYLNAHPEDAHEWISLAIAECDRGQLEDAERAYWRAAGLEPNDVSLHFNWLISALRAGDVDRAGYALHKLRSAAPGDWRTQIAGALVREKSGDARGAFAIASDLVFDCVEDEDDEPLEYVAAQALRLAARSQLLDEGRELVEHLFAIEPFSPDVLGYIREIEHPEARDLLDYSVHVDALYQSAPEPFGCIVLYRALARDAEEASAHALDFERRCGADDARVTTVEQVGACEGAHAGVTWRSERFAYPPDEFGV